MMKYSFNSLIPLLVIVAGVSSLVSIPFVILALSSGFPACFLYFIPSGLVSVVSLSNIV